MFSTVVLGLGSNWGDRRAQLKAAMTALGRVLEEMNTSPIYENPPLLPEGAPEFWNKPYLNMVIVGHTKLSPQKLLSAIQSIENRLGRQERGHWGPREIDIDILAYEDQVIRDEDLTVPHQEMLRRSFVMVPFANILPYWKYPNEGPYKGKTAEELVKLFGHQKDKQLRRYEVSA